MLFRSLEDWIVHEAVLRHGNIVSVTHDQAMGTIKVATRLILSGVGLIVIDVTAILAGASRVQLVRAQGATDIVFGL